MSWKKILKFQSDGLDQYNVDELLVHPIERLGFKLAKGHSYYHDVEGIFPGQFSLDFDHTTGTRYTVKRTHIRATPTSPQYYIFKGNSGIVHKPFNYIEVVDWFENEVESLT
jgi:hypothetical protein